MQAGREGGARREVGAQGGWRAGRLGARTKRNPSRRGVCVVVGCRSKKKPLTRRGLRRRRRVGCRNQL
jgi:hypothetical protein